jgi:hypothetical protein
MRRRTLAKLGLAAFLVVATALPARAGTTTVDKVDGVNFQYTATDTNGVLAISFTNPFNFVTQVNNGLVPQIPAEFAQLTMSPTLLIPDSPISGHFTPNLNTTKFGITSLSPPGAPNVVFDYNISFGQVLANGMTLSGTVALDPASALTFTQGGTTYDFSQFKNFGTFTLSLGTQDPTGLLLFNTMSSGNGSFQGSAQFSVAAIPEPSSMVLAGVCGLATVWVRRRRG